MISRHARFVVLGAGAMGTATAYHLALRGEPVLVVEQFALPHTRGSSHGAARITRHSYAELDYARLMPAAFDAWRALEADAAQPVYIRTGGVSISPDGVDYVTQVAASLHAIGVPHRRMSGREWNRINAAFAVPDSSDIVFEPDAGILLADQALAIQLQRAQSLGGDATVVLAETAVRRIDLEADRPVLICDHERIIADRLVVTAGAWAGKLLPALAGSLRPTRQQVVYLRPIDRSPFEIGRFPVFIYKGAGAWDAFYGMPGILGTGVKVARHGGPGVDPDGVEPIVGEEYRRIVRAFLQGHMPDLAAAPIDRTEVCLYTMTADERFILGPLPGRADVIVASPCSGHGFKFSCLIGRVLADLATTGTTPIDAKAWRRPADLIQGAS
jgi:sarcosine oxidase